MSVSATEAAVRLPAGLVMMERAAAALRGFLRGRGLDHYAVFYGDQFDLNDLDGFLPRLDADARWEALPLVAGGDQPRGLETSEDDDAAARLVGAGVLHLAGFEFVLARWHWLNVEYNTRETTLLAAAPDARSYSRLHRALVDLRRRAEQPVWEIVHSASSQERRLRKPMPWGDLLLGPQVLGRVRTEVMSFFTPPVAELYRAMNVPYRRGVLMHGPPGNGKTSIIRAIGASMPEVFAMILRPNCALGDGDLKSIFRRWRQHAPAILVIEDLDHLLKDYINLSHFLNHVDGIDGSPTGGLLLVATTNHPEMLDPAINNRPGRFDVVIEISSPDAGLRAAFFAAQLPGFEEGVRAALVVGTSGLSFAHLHEVIRLSGLLAINDGAGARTPGHLTEAARLVAASHSNARNGFPMASEVPFGLAQFRRRG